MPDIIIGEMTQTQIESFSPFITILMIDYLKTKYQNKSDENIEHCIEYILNDVDTYNSVTTTARGGFHRSIAKRFLPRNQVTEIFGKEQTRAEQIQVGRRTADNVMASLKKAQPRDVPSRPTSVSPQDLIKRCDDAIDKLEKACEGKDIMKLIQKLLEIINKRLNDDNDDNDDI